MSQEDLAISEISANLAREEAGDDPIEIVEQPQFEHSMHSAALEERAVFNMEQKRQKVKQNKLLKLATIKNKLPISLSLMQNHGKTCSDGEASAIPDQSQLQQSSNHQAELQNEGILQPLTMAKKNWYKKVAKKIQNHNSLDRQDIEILRLEQRKQQERNYISNGYMRVLRNSVQECLNESGASSLQMSMSQQNVIVEEILSEQDQSNEESKNCNKHSQPRQCLNRSQSINPSRSRSLSAIPLSNRNQPGRQHNISVDRVRQQSSMEDVESPEIRSNERVLEQSNLSSVVSDNSAEDREEMVEQGVSLIGESEQESIELSPSVPQQQEIQQPEQEPELQQPEEEKEEEEALPDGEEEVWVDFDIQEHVAEENVLVEDSRLMGSSDSNQEGLKASKDRHARQQIPI